MATTSGNEDMGRSRGLRFGLLIACKDLPRWQMDVVRDLLSLDGFSLEVVVSAGDNLDRCDAQSPFRVPSVIAPDLLFRLYRRLNLPPSGQREDVFDKSENAEVLCCNPVSIGRHSIYFTHRDVQTIKNRELDFLLVFGLAVLRGEILTAARYGIWSFHVGEVRSLEESPPCYWEIVDGEPVICVTLERLTDRPDTKIVLREGYFRTEPESYRKCLEKVFSGVTSWPAQVCVDLMNGRADHFLEAPRIPTGDSVRSAPANSEAIQGMLKIAANWIVAKTRVLFRHEQWNVGVIEQSLPALLSRDEDPVINWAPSDERNRFLADPFGMETERGCEMLVEEYDYCRGKGRISALSYESGTFERHPNSVMNSEFHHAYPYVFEHDGDVFCAPERRGSKEVALYRARSFPAEFERIGTLIKGVDVVDPTIFHWDGFWWLACAGAGFDAGRDLSIWYSEELLGTWRPHANNPVKTDIRNARPAGTPFVVRGKLYRPAQDSSRTYGGRVVINEVRELTTETFREEPVKCIGPPEGDPRYPEGLHTLAAAGPMTLVDGKRMVFSPCRAYNALVYWMRKRLPGLQVF